MPLSFEKGKNFWAVTRSDDYATDCAIGRHLAAEFAEYAKETDDGCTLGAIVRSIIAGGEFSGVETGFFYGLTERLL